MILNTSMRRNLTDFQGQGHNLQLLWKYNLKPFEDNRDQLLCRLRSIAAHTNHFLQRLSVCLSVCVCVHMSGSHTFLVVTNSYVLQATHAFRRMLPLCFLNFDQTLIHILWRA